MSGILVWNITKSKTEQVKLEDQSSLDAVTRQLPDGFYSTFRTFDGGTRVLGLTAHLQRLYEPVPAAEVDESLLRRELHKLLAPYRPGEARVRAVMTKESRVYVALAPLIPLPPEIYEKGVRAETSELQRQQPQLKSTSFIGRSDAERKHIAQEGIFEALLMRNGNILEGMTSNFFYVMGRDGSPPQVCTAGADILLGITRETVIDIARDMGLEVKYEPLKQDQLKTVSEAFITSSSRGVVPVVQIDGVTIGEGIPGPVTEELAAAHDAYVLANAEKIV